MLLSQFKHRDQCGCVYVCNHCMKPSNHYMSVCGPHHTLAIIKASCYTYVAENSRLHVGYVYAGWLGPEPEVTSEDRGEG